MSKITKYIGLDVHKDSISIAVAEPGRSKPEFLKRIPGDNGRLLKVLMTLGPLDSLHCAYEAGPTGYPLHRLLTEKGVRCEVVAPSEIPMKTGRRVKTDRIDSISLAHHLRAGNLVAGFAYPTRKSRACGTWCGPATTSRSSRSPRSIA